MHSVLLIIPRPGVDAAVHTQVWLDIALHVQNHIENNVDIPNNGCTKKLSEGVLWIDLKKSLPHFAILVSKAQAGGLPYQVLFFEEEPQWVLGNQ